jgi:hypothetical protein
MEELSGLLSWAVKWSFSPRVGLTFDKTPVFDIRKTSLLDRRMLVSRKHTTNVFDLASVWRKAKMRSLIEEG